MNKNQFKLNKFLDKNNLLEQFLKNSVSWSIDEEESIDD